MKKSVLIVDDEPGYHALLRYVLEPLGVEVHSARDGVEAVERIQDRDFDLVLMDIHMPRMHGIEALRRIHSLKPGLAVVIFSSSSDPARADEQEAVHLGAKRCLYKPFDVEHVLTAVRGALGVGPYD